MPSCCAHNTPAVWRDGDLRPTSSCDICELQWHGASSCFAHKHLVFVGDSITRYIFWSMLSLLCRNLLCTAAPPQGIHFVRCFPGIKVRLPQNITLEYVGHHYLTDLKHLLSARSTANAIYWNAGLWMDRLRMSTSQLYTRKRCKTRQRSHILDGFLWRQH